MKKIKGTKIITICLIMGLMLFSMEGCLNSKINKKVTPKKDNTLVKEKSDD